MGQDDANGTARGRAEGAMTVHWSEEPTSAAPTREHLESSARLIGMLMDFNRDRSVLRDPFHQFCAEQELSSPQSHIILWLGHEARPLSTGALSRLADINDRSITGIMDRLEARGLVRRTRLPADRRTVLNELTPRGRTLYVGIKDRMVAALAGFVATMSADEEATVFRLMGRLLAAVNPATK
ncbi:MarR family transcriptional regulator [Myxococcus stipitatus]|uniref:MarR family winged helix-turn-helix transcriptional regulator n=1 Tax=Myxococcus stipitatus TaxID=83455 RepID=UPI001F2E5CEA|nr:MarR family transcriptional regulator [Myxococcus stipitatus]MCE9673733.1 MarR family transcriptional regulator [Myxococcus stipitatus]